jgi:hypothetical protein
MSVLATIAAEPTTGGWVGMRKPDGSQTRSRDREALHYRLIYLVSVVIFLVPAMVGRLMRWSGSSRDSSNKSIIGEARAAANTVVPFVFMA